MDIKNPEQAQELYELLSNHYVEDDGGNFRFDYSVEFLTWALSPPNYKPDWLVGVRGGKKKIKIEEKVFAPIRKNNQIKRKTIRADIRTR